MCKTTVARHGERERGRELARAAGATDLSWPEGCGKARPALARRNGRARVDGRDTIRLASSASPEQTTWTLAATSKCVSLSLFPPNTAHNSATARVIELEVRAWAGSPAPRQLQRPGRRGRACCRGQGRPRKPFHAGRLGSGPAPALDSISGASYPSHLWPSLQSFWCLSLLLLSVCVLKY